VSVQAGIWNFDGKPVNRALLGEFSEALKLQGPDGEFWHVDRSIALLYRPFHTTAESRREKQPYVSARGFVITWDGRLDNREELASDLGHEGKGDATDVALFSAAFDRWESECFQKIIGDWAVSIWKPQERELIFACDFMAIRHIFYYLKNDRIWWSTDLTPLVLLSGDKFHVDDEYIAGYFAHDPEAQLTPYHEIRQVPPGQFVHVRNSRGHIERYWRFSPKSRIRYKSDAEYEEHFRHVFSQSIRRRLRSDSPILAELSGGLDSSSIVCMADHIATETRTPVPRIDTLSYYDTTEAHGDDSIYFQIVEARRGRTGHHIDVSIAGSLSSSSSCKEFEPLPGNLGSATRIESERAEIVRSGTYRAALSGIGGDEFLGGIPSCSDLLADSIAQLKFGRLLEELITWSLVKRRPAIQLLFQAVVSLLPSSLHQYFGKRTIPEPWISKSLVKHSRQKQQPLGIKQDLRFSLPSRRSHVETLLLMQDKLAKWVRPRLAIEEPRFPYLDQSLIEFVFSIPASQLLRPGDRRSLMRRSLAAIVPTDILARQTKQFGARTPVVAMQSSLPDIQRIFVHSLSSKLGYIEQSSFLESLHAAVRGKEIHIVRMLRTISLEVWLRDLVFREVIDPSDFNKLGNQNEESPVSRNDPPEFSRLLASAGINLRKEVNNDGIH
jgi:asparagine synthase (glutamine-hydrolysing)